MTQNPLSTLRADIEAHWREHRPQMVADLEAESCLTEAIETAASQTEEAVQNAVATGTHFWEAWHTYREQWAFLTATETADELEAEHWLTELGFYDEDEAIEDDRFDPYADDEEDEDA